MPEGGCDGIRLSPMSREEEEKKKVITGSVVTSVWSGADYVAFNSGSTTSKLCDLGQVTLSLCALAFISVEWG